MKTKWIELPHPGETIAEDFMKPLGLTRSEVARALNVQPITVSLLVRGKRAISPEMALRLATWSGASVQFWMNLQADYDRRIAERKLGAKIRREVSPLKK
jgi:antitoxin HigA-1